MIAIVHLSKTPLAGAPGRLARAQRKFADAHAVHFFEDDYPGANAGILVGESYRLRQEDRGTLLLLEEQIRRADIIHIHNQISYRLEDCILAMEPRARFVYHVHSPSRGEGPLYFNREMDYRLPFSARLVVGQIWSRMYPNYTSVPNICDHVSTHPAPHEGRTRIIFSPSHRRPGRWGTKICPELDAALQELRQTGTADVYDDLPRIGSNQLTDVRQLMDVTIDEISTGGFHQISLEGLQCGNAVVNGADEFSILTMMGWAGSKQRPPFVYADRASIGRVLNLLCNDASLLMEARQASYSYAKEHLNPSRLVEIYLNVYDKIR